MKNKLIIFFLLIISAVGSSQSNSFLPSQVILKSGDSFFVLGKFTNKIFKYKTHTKAKAKEIELSKIAFVQIRYSKDDIRTFKIFPFASDGQFFPLQELVKGKYVEVYGFAHSVNNMSANIMPVNSMNVIDYYIKKSDEDKLTYIGPYDALFGKFKNEVYDYFSDCELLIKKLEEKELRLRNGLAEIADFYNKNCGNK